MALLSFSVTLASASTASCSVDWASGPGDTNPANAADLVGGFTSGTLTFAAGETSKNIVLQIAPDATVEPSDQVKVTLSNPQPSGATIATATAIGIILNDDSAALTQHGTTAFVEPRAISGRAAVFKFDVPAASAGSRWLQFLFNGSAADAYCVLELVRQADGSCFRPIYDKKSGQSSLTSRVGPDPVTLPSTAFRGRMAIEADGSLSLGVDGQSPAFSVPANVLGSVLSGNAFGDFFGFRSADAQGSLATGTAATSVASGVEA